MIVLPRCVANNGAWPCGVGTRTYRQPTAYSQSYRYCSSLYCCYAIILLLLL